MKKQFKSKICLFKKRDKLFATFNFLIKKKVFFVTTIIQLLLILLSLKFTVPLWLTIAAVVLWGFANLIYYDDEIRNILYVKGINKKKTYIIFRKLFFTIIVIAFYLTPIINFIVHTRLAKMCFKEFDSVEIILCFLMIIHSFVHIFYYCRELVGFQSNINSTNVRYKITFFVYSIIQIVQIFTTIYLFVFAIDNNAFLGVDTKSSFSISFDFTFFSAMTFFTGSSNIVPSTPLSKAIVLIETLIFTLYISLIIFGVLTSKMGEQKSSDNKAIPVNLSDFKTTKGQTIIQHIENKKSLNNCLEIIRNSFITVAEEFNLTENNCPSHTAFMTIDKLEKQFKEGISMFLFYQDDIPVGYFSLSKCSDEEWELNNLAVLPEYRHLGIGKAMVDYAVKMVKTYGGTKISIGIIEENTKLKDWYLKLGFTHISTRKYEHLPFTVGFMEINI